MEGTCFRKTIDESFLERKKSGLKHTRQMIHRDIGGMGYTD